MTTATLRTYTAKDLAQMARQRGVAGWHSMRKDELISTLAATKPNGSLTGANRVGPIDASGTEMRSRQPVPAPVKRQRPTAAQKRLAVLQQERQRLQDLSNLTPTAERDQLLLLVRDPYWLQVTWEITPASVKRAQTALGQHWHGATPVLRISRLGEDGAVAATRQVKVHGGVGHWYVDVTEPPSRYRSELGYVDVVGEFYSLARSNEVRTPEAAVSEPNEHAWSEVGRNADRVFALSGGYSEGGASQELRQGLEDRLRRPLGRPTETRYMNGPSVVGASTLNVEIDAELVLRGSTAQHSHLTIQGEPIEVREDGSFAIKLPFPDRRQVIPVVASSADGLHQKTIILGVERNTKSLEPRRRDAAS